jgi:hypothetical protein
MTTKKNKRNNKNNKNRRVTKKKYTLKTSKKKKTFSHGGEPGKLIIPPIFDSNPTVSERSDANHDVVAQIQHPVATKDVAKDPVDTQKPVGSPVMIDGDDIISNTSSSLQEELANCHNYSNFYYAQNQGLASQLFRLQYPNIPPYDHQVRSATNVPYIKPELLYEQIKKVMSLISRTKFTSEIIKLLKEGRPMNSFDDVPDETIPQLKLVGIINRIEPSLFKVFKPNTSNAFFKVEFIPPAEEAQFPAMNPNDGSEHLMKYPAVAFIRCRIDNEALVFRAVYLVTSRTAIVDEDALVESTYESKLIGLLKIESPEKYEARRVKEEKPVTRLDGVKLHFDLKINGVETEMRFTGPADEVKKLADAINIEQRKIPDEIVKVRNETSPEKTDKDAPVTSIENNNAPISYAITRFHISSNINEQTVKNMVKGITSLPGLSVFKEGAKVTAKTTGAVAVNMAQGLAGRLFRGGKRKNMKYKTNNNKIRNKRNTKKK